MTNPKIIRSIVFGSRLLLTIQLLLLPIILFFALALFGFRDSPAPESDWLKFLIFVPPIIFIILGYVYASKLNKVYEGKAVVGPKQEDVLIWLTIILAILPAVAFGTSGAVLGKVEQIQGKNQVLQDIAWNKANCQRGSLEKVRGNDGSELYSYTCTGGIFTDGPYDWDQEIPK